MALDLALSLRVGSDEFPVQTLLANRDGVLVSAPRLFPRGTPVEVRNPANQHSMALRVVWSWVEGAGKSKTIRLALERVDHGRMPWEEAYEEALREAGGDKPERRRHPRRSLRLALEVQRPGATQPAWTSDVSERGASVLTTGPLAPGMLLRLVRPEEALHTQVRVVWVRPRVPELGDSVRAGLELVSPPRNFWGGALEGQL